MNRAWKQTGRHLQTRREHDTGSSPAWGLGPLAPLLIRYESDSAGFATRDWVRSERNAVGAWCENDLLSSWPALFLRLKKCTFKAHGVACLAWLRQATLHGRLASGQRWREGKECRRLLYLDLAELALVASPLGDAAGGFIARADGTRCTRAGRRQ